MVLSFGWESFNPHTHEGCDSCRRYWLQAWWRFQSTHPRRVWLLVLVDILRLLAFQSTHPRRVWLRQTPYRHLLDLFQSTHPRRVWQQNEWSLNKLMQVSIHTPTKGVTHGKLSVSSSGLFQSTHPRRVWPNILAPIIQKTGFNPHTHEGCDWSCRLITILSTRFQSTHPRRVWRFVRSKNFKPYGVSIHTPTKGVTKEFFEVLFLRPCFNPHTHEGCDLMVPLVKIQVVGFNPHTHEGCDAILLS